MIYLDTFFSGEIRFMPHMPQQSPFRWPRHINERQSDGGVFYGDSRAGSRANAIRILREWFTSSFQRQPPCLYGPYGIGKTSVALYAFQNTMGEGSSDDPIEITLNTNILNRTTLVNAIKEYAKNKLNIEFEKRYTDLNRRQIAWQLVGSKPNVEHIQQLLKMTKSLDGRKISCLEKTLRNGNIDEFRDCFFDFDKALLCLIETLKSNEEGCVNSFSSWLQEIKFPLVIFIIYSTAKQVPVALDYSVEYSSSGTQLSRVSSDISEVLDWLNRMSVRYVFELRGCEPLLYNNLQSIKVSSLSLREARVCVVGKGANRFQNGIRPPRFLPLRSQRKRQSLVKKVLEQTGTSPFLIQAVCFEWDRTRKKDLSECTLTIKDNLKEHFNEWWKSLPQDIRAELNSLANDESKLLQLYRSNSTTFNQLEQYGLVVNLNRKALIPRLVKDWLERKHMNIFISYSHRDSAFATRLASDLRRAGLDVFIYQWSLEPGDSIVQKINQAIKDSDYLIAILSPDSVQSPWVNAEIDTALMRRLSQRDISIIPVLYRHCDIPPLLKSYVYVDFTDSRLYNEGLSKLLEVFRRDTSRRAYLTPLPPSPPAPSQDASRQVPLPPSPAPPPAPSPCSRLDQMIRDDLIKELSDRLMMFEWMRLCLHLTDKLPEEVGANKEAQIATVVSQVYRHNRKKQDLLAWIAKNRPDLCE